MRLYFVVWVIDGHSKRYTHLIDSRRVRAALFTFLSDHVTR